MSVHPNMTASEMLVGGCGMAENVDNLILAHLREIRDRMGKVEERLVDIETGQQATQGILFALGGYMRGIDTRVEHIERKLGIEA